MGSCKFSAAYVGILLYRSYSVGALLAPSVLWYTGTVVHTGCVGLSLAASAACLCVARLRITALCRHLGRALGLRLPTQHFLPLGAAHLGQAGVECFRLCGRGVAGGRGGETMAICRAQLLEYAQLLKKVLKEPQQLQGQRLPPQEDGKRGTAGAAHLATSGRSPLLRWALPWAPPFPRAFSSPSGTAAAWAPAAAARQGRRSGEAEWKGRVKVAWANEAVGWRAVVQVMACAAACRPTWSTKRCSRHSRFSNDHSSVSLDSHLSLGPQV